MTWSGQSSKRSYILIGWYHGTFEVDVNPYLAICAPLLPYVHLYPLP